jgi:hypothetical protein
MFTGPSERWQKTITEHESEFCMGRAGRKDCRKIKNTLASQGQEDVCDRATFGAHQNKVQPICKDFSWALSSRDMAQRFDTYFPFN